jgi:hypothetical protein
MPWLTATGLSKETAAALTWEQVSAALQHEDNNRRHSNTDAVDAVMPLGWTSRAGEKGKARGAMAEQPGSGLGDSGQAHAAPAVAAKGKGPVKGARGVPPKPLDMTKWVCFHCLEVGHGVKECPTVPPGWKPTAESKRRVQEKKAELAKGKHAKVTHPSV